MPVKIAINGFGRIGRNVLRVANESANIDVVAINDLADTGTLAHLFKYDSVHGTFPGEIENTPNSFSIDGRTIHVFSHQDPSYLPWKELDVDIVIEATGCFTAREQAARHLTAGAKKVIISAPGENVDITVCMGINEHDYNNRQHSIISNASCTTNCLAPVVKVLMNEFGIVRGMMTTVHSYTNDQRILDLPHKDLRRGRALGVSMIPTTTGAAKATMLVIPELKGKLEGMAVRVPAPNVSLIDLVVETNKNTTIAEVNTVMRNAADNELRGILDYCDQPLVSSDFNGSPASSTFDALTTNVIGGNMVKVLTWYDNEWGYSNRIIDLVRHIANN